MAGLSEYELKRLKNIEENNKILESLGLLHFKLQRPIHVYQPPPVQAQQNHPPKPKQGVKRKNPCSLPPTDPEYGGFGRRMPTRRSRRLMGKTADDEEWTLPDDELEEDQNYTIRVKKIKENVFGHIPDIPVGTTWLYRMDCSANGVHRPTVAGIHGSDKEGVYSIALSGGYEDDVDYGECFTYTGSGGRDLKGTKNNPKNLRTAKQSKDQELTKANLALTLNIEKRLPVRVIRGFKLQSPYAPAEGYRYDGLYDVLKYWRAPGLSGFAVYKYALRRCTDQPPPPWTVSTGNEDGVSVDAQSDVKVENSDEAKTTDGDRKNHHDLSKKETEE